jgi:Arabinofuranosyltransferase N terminal/Arabinofuranosyltransferase A C terminal
MNIEQDGPGRGDAGGPPVSVDDDGPETAPAPSPRSPVLVGAKSTAEEPKPAVPHQPRHGQRPWWRRQLTAPGPVAVAVWLFGTVVAILLPRAFGIGGYGIRGWSAPLAYGLAGCVAILIVVGVLRHAPAWLAGAAAGFFGSWVTLMLGTAIRGTPFPFLGLTGDAGRLTAMATRYTVTWFSADAWVKGLPSEYPPLFPWLIGRTSVLIGVPVWKLVGDFEVLAMGFAILAGFLLWQRLVPAWVALAVTVFGFLTFADAPKAYEVVALVVAIPWALATFGRPTRGRLHWLVAGAIGGLIILDYYGWLMFGGIGMVMLAVMTWRAESNRKAYVIYLAKVIITATVVASGFIGPLAVAKLTIGGRTVTDLFGTAGFLDLLFPFIGTTPLAMLQLVGLVGMIFLRRSTWWATPMLTLVVGAYIYRVLGMVLFVLTQHTLVAQYTVTFYSMVFAFAGVLTLVDAVPKLLRRLSIESPRNAVLITMSIAFAWAGYSYAMAWMPNAGGVYSGYTEQAYVEPLPDGTYPVNPTNLKPVAWFPVTPIQREVEQVRGSDTSFVVLTADERLFSYLPWYGYTWNDLASSLTHTYERADEVVKLGRTQDPAAFTTASANTAFGPIDVFVLKKENGTWNWTSHMGFNQPELTVSFQASQFDPASWVVKDLPNDYVVAIRKP